MASKNKTNNLELNLWEPEDRPKRADFNTDNEKIDTALSEHIDDKDIHVSSSLFEAIDEDNKKIYNELKKHEDNVNIHVTDSLLASIKERAVVFEYIGTATSGRVIELPIEPKFVVVWQNGYTTSYASASGQRTYFAFGTQVGSSLGLELDGNKMKVWQESNISATGYGIPRLNERDKEYTAVLFM